MKYEEVFTVEISVGSARVARHELKAHDVIDVVEKLSQKYLSNHEGHSHNK
ncbi:hypothetical protein QUF88_02335 [Bacillus sp. DX1.1]|uniref:hypothetical protein n=1 Tax=unclassified Bacillus (in: firmicutes) TaxID=185979 RepID=UPI00256FEEC2|nr:MULTISPECIES: hypothetical protein [unclassified Bacillus (in: firmicutes)]MDM5152806.1 hypothetical protein [Bacillus sp. DX1.1]WJE84299.1 hypothetical protein QRE67_26920 [Bacillus sp. DX3.1]